MFQMLAVSISGELIDQIMQYVLWGTIALGVVFALILTIFITKGIKYSRQAKHNKKEKEKILKAFEMAKNIEPKNQKKA